MRDRILLILKFLVLVVGIGIFVLIRESLPIISGYGAKVLCSGVFVAGRNPEQVIKEDLAGFPQSLGTYTWDRADSSVTATVWGMASRKAIYRYGLGATLLSGVTEEELREQRVDRAPAQAIDQDTVDWPLGDRLAGTIPGGDPLGGGPGGQGGARAEDPAGGVDTAALRAAVGTAFGDGGSRTTGTRA